MSYSLYGATLALTWFLAANVGLSLVVALLSPRIGAHLTHMDAHRRARAFLVLRLLPASVSTLFAIGVFLPSFWTFEPRDFDEAFGVVTTLSAVAACTLIGIAVCRGATAVRDATRKSRPWIERARRVTLAGSPGPVFCLDAMLPAMTLVGILRPTLLVTERVIELLTPEELEASLAHETAHRHSWDNLKRYLMRTTPDALTLLGASRRLESEWTRASEQAADDRAANNPAARLALASALVKVATLTSAHPLDLTLASPLVGGDRLASRITRLIEGAPERPVSSVRRAARVAVAIAIGAAVAVNYPRLLVTVHQVSEVVVRMLP